MLWQLSAQSVGLLGYAALAVLRPAAHQYLYFFPQIILTPTVTPPPSVPSLVLGINWSDPAIIAAIVGFIGIVLVTIYQTRRSHKAERELELLRRKLDKQDRQQEQEEQREEAARREMLMAQNNVARSAAYRKALHVDPQISRLQILDMQRPLEMANIYVRVRVHEDTVVRYAIDPALATAAERRDPESFFQARHHYLEQRVGTAVDPDVAIRKYRRCVVVGDPGAGKTTLLKYLTLTLADGKYPDLSDLPIHVELNAFIYSEERDLLGYAARRWEERYAFPWTEARSYIDAMLRDGKAILLLDALDETVVGEQPAQAYASYQKAWDAIMHLAARYPQAYIVVTARKAGYQQHRPLDGFTVVEVTDFRQEDIRQFVDNWFRCTQEVARVASANDLIARLDRNPRIQALAANPLLLSLIVLVYEAQLDLPDRRAELYRECVDVLLAKDIQIDRGVRTRIAWALRQLRERSVALDLVEMLKDTQIADVVRGDIAVALGWLGERSVVPDLVGMLKDAQIADVVRGSVAGTLGMLGERLVVPDLIKMLKNSQIPDWVRTNIAWALGRLGERSVAPDLVEMLKDTQIADGLRGSVAGTLGMLGERSVVPDLIKMLKDSQIPDWVRTNIAEALGRLGERSVAQDLMEILKDTQVHDLVRGVTALALGQLGERSVVPDLGRMLKDRRIAYLVRSGVAVALWQFGERLMVPNLVAVLGDSQIHDWLRSKVANVLGNLAKDEETMKTCVLLLSQTSDYVADAIYSALWKMSRRVEVTIVVHDDGSEKTVEFVPWQGGVKG